VSQGPQTIYWLKNNTGNTEGFADNRVNKEWYMGTPYEPCIYEATVVRNIRTR